MHTFALSDLVVEVEVLVKMRLQVFIPYKAHAAIFALKLDSFVDFTNRYYIQFLYCVRHLLEHSEVEQRCRVAWFEERSRKR